jgi:hypothetical protein
MIVTFIIGSRNHRYTGSMKRPLLALSVGALVLLPLLFLTVSAQERNETVPALSPDETVPLSAILASARRLVDGKVIEVELEFDVDFDGEQRDGRWVYEVELLTNDNRIVELEFDARTGELLEIEGASWPAEVPRTMN